MHAIPQLYSYEEKSDLICDDKCFLKFSGQIMQSHIFILRNLTDN